MILVNPPIVKPSEPPPGIAKIAGFMNAHGIRCDIVDANIEGLLYLMRSETTPDDTWGRRASKNISRNLDMLRNKKAYRSSDRYRRAVMDANKAVRMAGEKSNATLSFGDYSQCGFSPVKSADLVRAASEPEKNPFYPYFSERLRTLLEKGTDLTGFSLNYLSQAVCTFAMIGFVKREHPRISVVVGGGLATSWMRGPGWRNCFGGLVDHWIEGPGEYPLLELVSADREVRGRPEGIHVLKLQCSPDYSAFPMGDYIAPGPIIPYGASQGCYWNGCVFCPERAENNLYRKTPESRVISDMVSLTEKMRPTLIHVTDNAISPALMKTLIKDQTGTPWYGFARITKELADRDFCRSLKQSGCVMLKLGLESGDGNVLEAMGKGIDLETASRVLCAIKEAGIGTYVHLLFGTPAEALEEARRTLLFVARHCDFIDFLNVAVFNLPVNAPDAKRLETRGFYEGDLSLYRDFIHPKKWSRKNVREFIDREFKRHPAISPIIRRDPPIFTSNHAPFFCGSL